MTLRSYLRILRERWVTILVFVLVATGAAIGVTALTAKSYQACAQDLVVTSTSADASVQAQANAFVQYQVPTFAKVIGSPEVLKSVKADLHLPLSDREIKDKLTASAKTGEAIIDVCATDGDPDRATDLANSAARGLKSAVESYSSSVKLFVTSPADTPASPTSPKPLLNVLLGFLLGLLVGAAVAVVRDILDNRVKDPEDLATLAAAPAMGTVVEDSATEREPLASRAGGNSVRSENFRQLRANLQFANVDEHPRVLAVTSSIPAEGKTTVAINLAGTLAEAGFRVCLVDADLRRPMIATNLGLSGDIGLTNVLIQQMSLVESLQDVGPNLAVLASGPTPPNPSEVLASTYVRDAIRSLLDSFDYVVVDTAPLLPVADGAEVAALADGTLLVARHNVTTDTNVKHAVAALRRVDARLLGVLLNRVPQRGAGSYGYGYEYYRNPGDGQSLKKAKVNGRGDLDTHPDARPVASPGGRRARHRPADVPSEEMESARS